MSIALSYVTAVKLLQLLQIEMNKKRIKERDYEKNGEMLLLSINFLHKNVLL